LNDAWRYARLSFARADPEKPSHSRNNGFVIKLDGAGVMGGKQLGFSDYNLTTAKKQQWFSLSDQAMEEALNEVPTMRCIPVSS